LDPLQIELPVRANEAAALAEVIFQVTDGRRLTDDLRARAAGRAGLLGLETIVPHMGSLQADPVHPSSFFLAIDAVRGGIAKPYLLRLAGSSAPSSGLFQRSILIGRMRPGGGREIVINGVPFDSSNREAVRTFAKEVDRMLLPRPTGNAFAVSSSEANAFSAFHSIHQESGLNAAALTGEWHEGVLRAIRAGWREGYGLAAAPIVLHQDLDPVSAAIDTLGYTRIVVDVAGIPSGATCVAMIGAAYDAAVRGNASQQWSWKRPDLEVCWDSAESVTSASEIASLLQSLRESGRAVQCAAPKLDRENWQESAEAVRAAGAVLRVSSSQPGLQEISRACGGRVYCVATPGEDLRALVKLLRS
jgi:hypothetical protein